jgi:two-component system chemotaxis sensor kinase CheA
MVYRLRGNLLPIVSLSSLLEMSHQDEKVDIPETNTELSQTQLTTNQKAQLQLESNTFQIIIVEANECLFGIIVSGIDSTQDIVVKPLSYKIKELLVYSGVTILGNGDVALILDLNELARKANLHAFNQKQAELSSKKLLENQHKQALSDTSMVLLVETKNQNRIAIPFGLDISS